MTSVDRPGSRSRSYSYLLGHRDVDDARQRPKTSDKLARPTAAYISRHADLWFVDDHGPRPTTTRQGQFLHKTKAVAVTVARRPVTSFFDGRKLSYVTWVT